MVRAKNTADDEQVVKLLCSNMNSLGDGFKSSCMDTVLASYESFLLDYLLISSRFSAAQLSRCASKAFEGACDKDSGLFGRQLSHALSYARVKSKSITSGAKTHKSTHRIIQAISKQESKQESRESLPKPSPRVWRGASQSPAKKRTRIGGQASTTSPLAASSSSSALSDKGMQDIYKMYGVDEGPAGAPVLVSDTESEVKSCNQDRASLVNDSSRAVAVDEDGDSSKITSSFLDKAQGLYMVTLRDGTVRRLKPFRGPDRFLRVKMFGKLKKLDSPNLLLDTLEKKHPVLKRPSIKTTPKRSAGLSKEAAQAEPSDPIQESPKATPKKWTCMLYSKTGKEAVRRLFGDKKQLFQFGGPSFQPETRRKISRECLQKLREGMPEDEAENFCRQRLEA